nr:E388 [uncultured bacterium]
MALHREAPEPSIEKVGAGLNPSLDDTAHPVFPGVLRPFLT